MVRSGLDEEFDVPEEQDARAAIELNLDGTFVFVHVLHHGVVCGSAVVLALDLRLLQDLGAVDAHRDGGRVHVPGGEVRGPQDELGFRVGLAHGRDW